MKSILSLLITVTFLSCTAQQKDNSQYYKAEIARLDARIDSLLEVISGMNKSKSKYSVDRVAPVRLYEKKSEMNYSGQCKATTKKGTRCSRKAGSNGYCWQH